MSGLGQLFASIGKRGFRSTATIRDASKNANSVDAKPAVKSTPPPSTSTATSTLLGGDQLKATPTALDRSFLVWSGQFKNKNEIPNQLENHRIRKAREWGRIRVNVYILIAAVGCCGVAMYLGKQAAKRGESLEQQNLAWHREIKEEYKKQSSK